MAEKPKSLHVLGLEFVGKEIYGAKLSQKRGKPTLDDLFTISLPSEKEEGNVKPLYIQSSGKLLTNSAKRYLISVTLPPSDVLVRAMEVSLKKEKDIDSVLSFQAEPLLPYPAENAILDRVILSQNNEGSRLTILAAKKERVEAIIERWKTYQIEPEVVSCIPAALANFSTLAAPNNPSIFVIHLSKFHAVCTLVKDGHLAASQNCSKNLDSLLQAFAADTQINNQEELLTVFSSIKWGEVNATTHPFLNECIEQLNIELTRTLFALGKINKGEEIPDILITGDCGTFFDLTFYIGHLLGKHVVTPDFPQSFKAPLPLLLKFAVPIGLALGSLPSITDAVSFRQGELSYPDPWKRLKKPLAIYFGMCLLVSTAIFIFGEAYLGYLEDDVRREYTDLLAIVQVPHSNLEKEIGNSEESGNFLTLKNLSMDQLQTRVQKLEKDILSTPDIYPLHPNILSVSDVLAWLNSQPTVTAINPKTGKVTPLIQIDNFSYNMVKRPEISKKSEKYQVKVELEFTSPTPKEAREFHDALIAPNAVVDPKGEVKWSTNRGKYRASFYLKDKTIYPAN